MTSHSKCLFPRIPKRPILPIEGPKETRRRDDDDNSGDHGYTRSNSGNLRGVSTRKLTRSNEFKTPSSERNGAQDGVEGE